MADPDACEVLSSLGDPARLRRAAGRDLTHAEVELMARSFAQAAGDDPDGKADWSYQDAALLDEIDSLLGTPPRLTRSVREDDPYVIDGVNILTGEDVADWEPEMRELTTSIERTKRARRVDDEADIVQEYGHIVVDEAQDLSPMQWRMLGRRGRQATWTVVEDPAQSASGGPGRLAAGHAGRTRHRPGRQRSAAHHPQAAQRLRADDSYRNSVEIAAVATRVLAVAVPDAKPARAVRVSGFEAEVLHLPDADQNDLLHAARDAVIDMLGHVEGTVGVIFPLGWPRANGTFPTGFTSSTSSRPRASNSTPL